MVFCLLSHRGCSTTDWILVLLGCCFFLRLALHYLIIVWRNRNRIIFDQCVSCCWPFSIWVPSSNLSVACSQSVELNGRPGLSTKGFSLTCWKNVQGTFLRFSPFNPLGWPRYRSKLYCFNLKADSVHKLVALPCIKYVLMNTYCTCMNWYLFYLSEVQIYWIYYLFMQQHSYNMLDCWGA